MDDIQRTPMMCVKFNAYGIALDIANDACCLTEKPFPTNSTKITMNSTCHFIFAVYFQMT